MSRSVMMPLSSPLSLVTRRCLIRFSTMRWRASSTGVSGGTVMSAPVMSSRTRMGASLLGLLQPAHRHGAQPVDEEQDLLDRAPEIVHVRVENQLGPERFLVLDGDVGRCREVGRGGALALLGAQVPAGDALALDTDLRRAHELDLGEARDQLARGLAPGAAGRGGVEDDGDAGPGQELRGIGKRAMGNLLLALR